MSGAALLAGLAALLAAAATWELLRAEPSGPSFLAGIGDRGGRAAAAAIRLGLPRRIERAGMGERLPFPAVLLAKLSGAVAGGLVGLAAAPAAPARLGLLILAAMPLAGFFVPDALLERAARKRHRRLIAALPDALDLLAVSAGSGSPASSGFARIAGAGRGPLAAELGATVAELSCGVPLAEALDALRERVPGNEVAALCASIERSRRFGSPLADQLHRQAAALRRDQRRLVEERAARAAPKIQLVVALVLVPSVLLMIGAALIANADALLGGY